MTVFLTEFMQAFLGSWVATLKWFQVHRHHVEGPDPLVYGRTMTGEPESSEGAAVHMLSGHQAGAPVYSVVTYE